MHLKSLPSSSSLYESDLIEFNSQFSELRCERYSFLILLLEILNKLAKLGLEGRKIS
jgi:hypothetical protein